LLYVVAPRQNNTKQPTYWPPFIAALGATDLSNIGVIMNKEQAQVYIQKNVKEDDTLIGFFQAISPPKIWMFFVLGPLAILSMRMYFLAVTERGIYFYKLSLLGKFKDCDFFEFDEIENVKIGKGILQRPMKFHFKNNRKIKVKAQLKGHKKVAKVTADVQSYIENRIPLAQ
jgi:hypothetical protein